MIVIVYQGCNVIQLLINKYLNYLKITILSVNEIKNKLS